MRTALVLAVAMALLLPGCASWDQIWNGRVVTEPGTEIVADLEPAGNATSSSSSQSFVPPEASTTDSGTTYPTASDSPTTGVVTPSQSSSSSSPTSSPSPEPGIVGSTECVAQQWQTDVVAAQEVLSNLSRHHVAEHVAGYVNGSYVSQERFFDLENRSLAYSSFQDHARFAAVGPYYAVYAQDAYRGRDDAPDGAATRRLAEALPGDSHPLVPWRLAALGNLTGECQGSGANSTVVARLPGSFAIEVRIVDGKPVQATVRGSGVQLEITYDYAPPPARVDGALPARAVPLQLETTGNVSRVLSTDFRLLDGHLVLHALDEQGYAIFAVSLTESHAETRDDAYLAYQDDGDGYWGPGDVLSWGGSTASVRLLDTWAGQFAADNGGSSASAGG